VGILESKWIIEVGRRLLARRAFAPRWRAADIAEHKAIADAVERGDADGAEALMREHIDAAVQHWNATSARHEH
jgi:DNA-binding GntR family transcriptional regulator